MPIVIEASLMMLALAGVGLPSAVPGDLIGRWGGDHVVLSVTAGSARMTLDCGTGAFPMPTTIDRHGDFSAAGTLQLYHAGPTRADVQPIAPKALYQGRLEGDRLTLEVITATPSSRRHYALTRNSRVKLVRCL